MDTLTAHGQSDRYEISLQQEKQSYESCLEVHNLPEIYHYWSNRHLRPKLLPFGFGSPNSMFTKYLGELCDKRETRLRHFISLGAGNCELEIEIALFLRDRGKTNFLIDCFELNSAMLERGRTAATEAGVADQLVFTAGDLNDWDPAREYDAAFANQSLHHVMNLERLFEQVKRSLRPDGRFIVSDMIGRNGHQRWPEALTIVREFWRLLPPSCRFNHQLLCYEDAYEDWDCSKHGFEGIRSQDILPLLLDHFHFHLFIPFANVVDPFIDRSFGPNFDAAGEWDRWFVDQVNLRDEREIARGRIKPTHMLAVLGKQNNVAPVFPQHLSPGFCVRRAAATPLDDRPKKPAGGPPQSQFWPRAPERELEIACERLGEASRQIRQRTAWALSLEKDLDERTAWALSLERDLEDRTAWALGLERELNERTAWAFHLQREIDEQSSRAVRLERELHHYIHNPFRYALRLAFGVRNRLKRISRNRKNRLEPEHPPKSPGQGPGAQELFRPPRWKLVCARVCGLANPASGEPRSKKELGRARPVAKSDQSYPAGTG